MESILQYIKPPKQRHDYRNLNDYFLMYSSLQYTTPQNIRNLFVYNVLNSLAYCIS